MSKSKILFLLSGSIAAFKAAQVISKLVQDGHSVRTVATPQALQFLGPATLEGLTGQPVLSDLWERGQAMQHIELTRWADMAVLCPASANTLAKMSGGLADDLVSTLVLAWPLDAKPFHVFPAMNSQMLSAEVTRENLKRISARGFQVWETGHGALACGEQGEGRLLDVEEILSRLQPRPSLGRILITAGATREPIDGIRFISNVSTGQTGAALADALSARGWQVTFLHGQGAQISACAAHRVAFSSFNDLERRLRAELDQRDYRAIIHAAAVSDYSVEGADTAVKMNTDQSLSLRLKANPKLLPQLRGYSRRRDIKVIGFKLTLNASSQETEAKARDILGTSVDAVVANDWSEVDRDRSQHPGRVVWTAGAKAFQNLNELAGVLHDFMS